MVKIVGISGSLRKGSFNSALLKAAAGVVEDGEIEIATIEGIPLYNGDVEKEQGVPEAVLILQQKFEMADGILIVSPEYNNGVPGVLKNAIDWLTRPNKIDTVFAGKPLAMMGASPGGFGTLSAQTGWLPVWRTLHVRLWNDRMPLMVSRAHTVFDAGGDIIDDKLRENLKKFIAGFIGFVRMQKSLNSK